MTPRELAITIDNYLCTPGHTQAEFLDYIESLLSSALEEAQMQAYGSGFNQGAEKAKAAAYNLGKKDAYQTAGLGMAIDLEVQKSVASERERCALVAEKYFEVAEYRACLTIAEKIRQQKP